MAAAEAVLRQFFFMAVLALLICNYSLNSSLTNKYSQNTGFQLNISRFRPFGTFSTYKRISPNAMIPAMKIYSARIEK